MLLDYLEHSNQLQNSSINETLDSLNITINPSVPISSFFPKLFDELKTLAKRDSFELLVEIEGTHEAITNSSNDCYKKIDEHINEFDADSEYEIELRVKKHLNDKTISVYFIDAFSEYLNKLSSLSLINSISRSFDHILIFEVFSKINNFGSDSIRFIEANAAQNSYKGNISSFDREKKLSLLFDNVTTSNFSLKLLPDDFYLLENSESEIINDIFTNISSILSIVLISNSSLFENDGAFSYKISGYKSISEKVNAVNYDRNTCDILYKIYSWSYEGGNSSDKIGLVRNVLSIHLNDNNKIKIDNEAWQAIQSNYQIYLKENIQSYLEIKNKIGEFVIESSSMTYTMADEILSSFKNSIFVFITFFLTVVVVNGLKDTGAKSIFSDVYLAIVLILCLISIIWREMTTKQVVAQFESASATVKKILQLNYSKVLMQDEIDQCIDPVISTNRSYLKNQVSRYSKWWLGIILVFGLTYGLANLYFENSHLLKSEASQTVSIEPNKNADSTEAANLTNKDRLRPAAILSSCCTSPG